jgi:hypothetical protein
MSSRPIEQNAIHYDKDAQHSLPLSSTPTRSYLTWLEGTRIGPESDSHEGGGQELVGGARRPAAAVGLAARHPGRQVRPRTPIPDQCLPSHLGCWVCALWPFYASASLRIGGSGGFGTPVRCSVKRKFGILGGLGS